MPVYVELMKLYRDVKAPANSTNIRIRKFWPYRPTYKKPLHPAPGHRLTANRWKGAEKWLVEFQGSDARWNTVDFPSRIKAERFADQLVTLQGLANFSAH